MKAYCVREGGRNGVEGKGGATRTRRSLTTQPTIAEEGGQGGEGGSGRFLCEELFALRDAPHCLWRSQRLSASSNEGRPRWRGWRGSGGTEEGSPSFKDREEEGGLEGGGRGA